MAVTKMKATIFVVPDSEPNKDSKPIHITLVSAEQDRWGAAIGWVQEVAVFQPHVPAGHHIERYIMGTHVDEPFT